MLLNCVCCYTLNCRECVNLSTNESCHGWYCYCCNDGRTSLTDLKKSDLPYKQPYTTEFLTKHGLTNRQNSHVPMGSVTTILLVKLKTLLIYKIIH